MRSNEYLPDIRGDFFHIANRCVLRDALHQFRRIETSFPGRLFKEGVDFKKNIVVHDLTHIGHGKNRFNPRGCIGDNGNCTRRGNGGHGSIPDRRFPFLIVYGIFVVRKSPPFAGQFTRCPVPLIIDELHNLPGQLPGLFRIIRDAQHDQHVGPTHYSQADFTIAQRDGRDFGKGIFIDLNNVIQKMNRQVNHILQPRPVNGSIFHHFPQID